MSKQVLSATALALLIGMSAFGHEAALAQNGGEARSNDPATKKALDDKHLTPVRPIRRVGDDNWPAAKDQPAPMRETTGQSAQTNEKQQPAQQETKQETPKQDAARQEPAKQDTAKQDANQDPAKPEQKQDAAKPQDTANQDTANKAGHDNNDKGFASIRLGTDESGHVAVNDAQERQIAKAMRKQRVDTVDVKVSAGSVAPANVRLTVVSSDMVDILPQFRGYSFFATREEIVIVEPSSRKVVALIPVKVTATASRSGEERATRTEARRTETRRNDTRTKERDVTVGRAVDVPSREEILAAPVARGRSGTTVSRTYRTYQYEEPADVVIIERRPRFFPFW